MDFTREEINLCEQIAKKYRKKIVFGIWLHDLEDPGHLPFLWCNLTDELKRESAIPLWTISDCISWLREKGFYLSINTLGEYWTCLAYKHIFNEKDKDIGPRIFFQKKTLLEVCLKTTLAVLEEK